MNEHKASRTLVKSPPELWAECSDASSLTRHLDQFGEITITKLEPESTVAWEGERVSGTVRIEPSGWGTRVTLTASVDERAESAEEHEPEPERALEPRSPSRQPRAGRRGGAGVGSATSHRHPRGHAAASPRRARSPARLLRLHARRPPAGSAGAGPVRPRGSARARPRTGTRARARARSRYSLSEGHDLEQPELAAPEPVSPDAAPAPEMAPVVADLLDAEAALVAALDSLGQAHHRPFSRA